MIISSNIAAFIAAPSLFLTVNVAVQDVQENARISYNNCLVDAHNIAVKAKTPAGKFAKTAKTQCVAQRKSYYDIIYKNEKADDVSNQEADEYATEEANSVLDYIIREYAVNLETQPELVKNTI